MSTMEGFMRVADEESQWANEWMGLPENIRVVRMQVGRKQGALTPVLATATKTYHTYPPRRSPGPTNGGEGDGYAFNFAMEVEVAA